IHVTYVGHHDLFRNVTISNTNRTANLGSVELGTDNILLDAAVVTAKAAEIVVRGDTVEYNADSYKVTESAILEDLLKKMPGIEIDSEGKITVNGREIKKIMVDGEEFFSTDPKVASKNLPAKMVEKLQVLDRRTDMAQMTGFDDGEEETIINLMVKPGMKEGLFGNAFVGYGTKDRYEGNAMVNYMKDKNQYTVLGGFNNTNNAGFSDLASSMFGSGGGGGRRMFFGGRSGITTSGNAGFNFSQQFTNKLKLGGNLRYGNTDNNTLSKTHTQNILSSGNTLEDENNSSNNYSQNFNMDLRLEWTPDTLTRIIFNPEGSVYNNRRTELSDFLTTTETLEDSINYGDSRYNSTGDGKNLSARLDVSRTLGKKGRILSVQLRGGMSDSENEGTNLSNTFYNGTKPDDLIDQRFVNTNDSKNWRGYVSYVEPLGNNNAIQFAYQYRQNISGSDKDTRVKDESGNYTVLDEQYSKRLENNFTNQEIEFNFQSVRQKYDYTIGFSVQPSSSQSKTFIGDNKISDFTRDVVNYAPMAQFNYRWTRQHNLRLRYFGNTDQPSVTQLSPVVDVSNPLNITYGNPDLKPSFEHRLNLRYQNFNPEKNRSMGFFGDIRYLTNDIVSSTMTDRETGRRETTYENVTGNWNANGRMMMNIPLKNIRFSVFSMSFASYNHANGFSNLEKNLSRRLNLGETLGLNYRSDLIDFGIRGNISYNKVKNSLEGQRDQEFLNYGGNANTTLYLPWDMSIESDINYSTNSGYSDGFTQDEWLWNASIQKQLFKQKNGTIRLKIYDILQQRSNISRSVTSNYIRDTTTNTLTTYFMVHFVYRFNIFKNGATREDMMPQHGPGPGRGFGRGHGG
ncbi:MAG TPA: TonB-dependent receptor, partial [Porphyromonadaceae bacterium]|nr:TonB-dependent receptor [Porphyromonadaceae bacterium]HBF96763.1 TonB-dependent receptor [Porphyromonadaceae bacterium]HCB88833.1 TonB-dependent receptor [Porphyromonadaceae bacterium]HCF80140.1 TonB-dependent receptor [Porphyromonadaceae bacterium]